MEVRAGFKQTDIGLIPIDWDVKKFIDITKVITCGLAATPIYVDESIGKPFLSAQNVQDGKVTYEKHRYISKELFDQITKHNKPEKGDLLYTRVGAGIGEAGVIEDDYEFGIYVSLTLIKVNEKYIQNYYLLHVLNSPKYKFFAKNGQFAGGGVQNLNVQIVRDFLISLPSIEEQTAIATALSDADALITSLEKLIKKKRAIKQGAMQKCLNPDSCDLYDSDDFSIPNQSGQSVNHKNQSSDKWVVKKLGEELDKIVGGGTPSRSNKEYWGGGIPWVTVKDFATFNPLTTQEFITKKGLENSASHLIPKNTLITSTRMGLGKAIIYNVDVSINQDLKALFPTKNLSTDYLYYWFQKNSSIIEKLGSGSTVMGISLIELKNIEFAIPPIEEQTRIATILSDMDAEIAALEQKLGKYKLIKQGMMQELLTGRVRLEHQ